MEDVTQEQSNPPGLPQRRILATSVRGDQVWRICQPVLEWLISNGDETLAAEAIKTRAYWEAEQAWLIDLLNKQHYFTLAEKAMQDPKAFKKALCSLPPCTGTQVDVYLDGEDEPRRVDAIAYLALVAGERHNQRFRIRYRTVGKRRKR